MNRLFGVLGILVLSGTVANAEDCNRACMKKTVTKKGGYRQDYIDLKARIAAAHVTLHEEGALLEYSVLLRVENRKIAGIETLVNRITPESRFQPNMLDNPPAYRSFKRVFCLFCLHPIVQPLIKSDM